MTRRTIALLSAAVAAATPVSAQLTGGGSGVATTQTRAAEPAASTFGAVTALRIGTLSATGEYGSMPSQTGYVYFTDARLTEVFGEGSGATSGYYAELSRFQPVVTPHPMVAAGLEFSLSAGYVEVDWAAIQASDELDMATPDAIADLRIGPSISVSPVPNLYLSAAYKLGVGIVYGSSFEQYEFNTSSASYSIDDYDSEDAGSSRTSSFGANVRYGSIMLGWETHAVSGPRVREYNYYNNSTSASGALVYELPFDATTSRVYLGFAF